MLKIRKYKKKYNDFLNLLIKVIEDDKRTEREKYHIIHNIILVENVKNILED